MPKLIIEKGVNKDQEITVGRTVFAGRDTSAHILLAEPMISRLHFKIEHRQEGYFLVDLGSLNGTFVNRARVKERLLKPGDMIQVGDTIFSFVSDDPSSQQKSLVGKIIGGCAVMERVGRGGMGTVYKALQISLNRTVALKILAPEMLRDKTFVDMFLREARAAAQLNHHNIVQVYDVGLSSENIYYFSMEFMPGGSIQELMMKKPRLPLPQAIKMMIDAASGLAFAEKKGIVHRDIKPDNLMLNEDDTVKIGDLGLATFMEATDTKTAGLAHEKSSETTDTTDKKHQNTLMGTPHYLSPEQAQDKSVDHRSDIYSLGASFYRIISGVTPYIAPSVKELITKKLREDPKPLKELLPSVPDLAVQIISRMMQRKRNERYSSANELLKDLRLLQNGLELVSEPINHSSNVTIMPNKTPKINLPLSTPVLPESEQALRRSFLFKAIIPSILSLLTISILFFIGFYYFSGIKRLPETRQSPNIIPPPQKESGEYEEKRTLEYLKKARGFENSLSATSSSKDLRILINNGIELYAQIINEYPKSGQVKPAQEGIARLNLMLKELDNKDKIYKQEQETLTTLEKLIIQIEVRQKKLQELADLKGLESFISQETNKLDNFSRQFPRFTAITERVESQKTALSRWHERTVSAGEKYRILEHHIEDLIRQRKFAIALKDTQVFADNIANHNTIYDNLALALHQKLESLAKASFNNLTAQLTKLKDQENWSEALKVLETASGTYGLSYIENSITNELAWFKTQRENLYQQNPHKEAVLFPFYLSSLFWSLQSGQFDDWENKIRLIDSEFRTKEYQDKLASYIGEMRFEKGIIDRFIERFNQRRIDQPTIQGRRISGIDTANGVIYLDASGPANQRLVKFHETSIRDWELCLSGAWNFDAKDFFELGFFCIYRGGNVIKAEEFFDKSNKLIHAAPDKLTIKPIQELLIKYRPKAKLEELKTDRESQAEMFKEVAEKLYEDKLSTQAIETFQLLRYRYSNTFFYVQNKIGIDTKINILTGK